ncbi:MAG TPA: uroporphyrinogen-III synthase [Gammaproteobacteria bacterium]|jgi:uroporphyrinogen-III synthase|nr:uroporphyrinogen-III synthase [Gammaproteobacteria bacterium]
MKHPFQGMRVLVTQLQPQGGKWCEKIRASGGEAVYFPTIEIFPLVDTHAFHQALAALPHQARLIFISPQAVYLSMPHIKAYLPQLSNISIAAVGLGTANALREMGVSDILYPAQAWHSEGLLALPQFAHVTNQKIAVIRGEGGRELIDTVLSERGASILAVVAYRRVLPRQTVSLEDLFYDSGFDIMMAGSFESVKNIKVLAGQFIWKRVKNVPLIVTSQRIKTLAEALGFETVLVVDRADPEIVL